MAKNTLPPNRGGGGKKVERESTNKMVKERVVNGWHHNAQKDSVSFIVKQMGLLNKMHKCIL
jgi:hypothetical protein